MAKPSTESPKPWLATVRGSIEDRDRWFAAANAAGKDFSTWARDVLDASAEARTGAPAPRGDAEFTSALDSLRIAYGIRDPAEAIRMAVLAAVRRLRAGVDPFRVPEPVVTIPAPPVKPTGRK